MNCKICKSTCLLCEDGYYASGISCLECVFPKLVISNQCVNQDTLIQYP